MWLRRYVAGYAGLFFLDMTILPLITARTFQDVNEDLEDDVSLALET